MSDYASYSSNYENLLAHLNHHDIKKGLLRWAKDDEAYTIREAIERCPESKLRRGLAVILAR